MEWVGGLEGMGEHVARRDGWMDGWEEYRCCFFLFVGIG
jgi:hypothetical protein